MKQYLTGIFYSLPVQLLLMQFRKNLVLLFFWYILFATISGNFLQPYGANTLYLAPEYLGKVNALSTALTGFAMGIFIMSWNITTFILFTRYILFLATTAQPFLKYCINNAVLPVLFLIAYFYYLADFQKNLELLNAWQIILLIISFLGGLALCLLVSFIYFFRADKTIFKNIGNVIIKANKEYEDAVKQSPSSLPHKMEMRTDWFLSARFGLRKPRKVQHYSREFLDSVFKRHHFAAVIAITLAFILLLVIGFFSDNRVFQVPAAASITLFFAILVSVVGALFLFLGNWAFMLLVVLYFSLNWMYNHNIIDPRNKAFGLDYSETTKRAVYSQASLVALSSKENADKDKAFYVQVLNNWKAKQSADTPVIFVLNVSGGGTRSATFALNVLQQLDSVTSGKMMPHTILITGASGGMFGATYFRELYLQRTKGAKINLQNSVYATRISKDLLNPLFLSFTTRDLAGPVQKFDFNGKTYVKDRAYAFEQRFNQNTRGVLNKKIGDYAADEASANIPLMFLSNSITRDGRQMFISTHSARFMMRPATDTTGITYVNPDNVDFTAFFEKADPLGLSMLSALRMNATFPYVLPNVWLPTVPVIDVMDAGLRDNFGTELSLRFISSFSDWLKQNTSKLVVIQIRDHSTENMDEPVANDDILSFVTKPLLVLQKNWFALQDYYKTQDLSYFSKAYGNRFQKITFQYIPSQKDNVASISFHLTASEKKDIEASLNNPVNIASFDAVKELLK